MSLPCHERQGQVMKSILLGQLALIQARSDFCKMLLVSEQNQTAAVSLVVGFGFFPIFVSFPPPIWMLSLEERQCSDSKRNDVL